MTAPERERLRLYLEAEIRVTKLRDAATEAEMEAEALRPGGPSEEQIDLKHRCLEASLRYREALEEELGRMMLGPFSSAA